MTESCAQPPVVKPRQSLSARLWLLTTLAVLLSEVLVFLPYIAHERTTWLAGRLEDASIAVLAAAGTKIDAAQADELLQLAGAEWIRLTDSHGASMTIGRSPPIAAREVDLRGEGLLTGIRHALHAIIFDEDRPLRIVDAAPLRVGSEVEAVLHDSELSLALRRFASDFAGLALLIAGVTGGLVYLAVLVLLVRPMRRITGSIAAFRADPERTRPLDPDDVTLLPNDEIAIAGRELANMQHELRSALWRNARLAALGTVVAKVSHDLRGILTPALLTAERLQMNSEPRIRRAGDTLVQAVERATDLVRRTLDYAREGPPPLELGPIELARLLDEAGETARPLGSALRLENGVDRTIQVRADRIQLFRVLSNLLRNAAEAGARTVRITAERNSPTLSVDIADDGPGLPEAVRAELFRPFAGSTRRGGSGLGLAIARDLMVAHGGDIELIATDGSGTTFRLTLRLADAGASSPPSPADAQIAPAAAADV